MAGVQTWALPVADNQDGIRPASVTVRLFANGTGDYGKSLAPRRVPYPSTEDNEAPVIEIATSSNPNGDRKSGA